MGTDKRARQKANRAAKLAEQESETKTETREATTKRVGIIVAVVAAIIAIFVLFSFLGGDDETSNEITFTPTPVPETEAEAPVEVQLASEIPSDFEPFSGTGVLASVEPSARDGAYNAVPDMTIDPSASYAAVLNTDAGAIRVELFADEAPIAVNNFVNLARDGFYDGLIFHRVMADFMAQGGDPTGTGTGGPGYTFEDEVDTGRIFDQAGLLAMANSGPATNGSQFFITFEPTPWLDGAHTIFGQLVGDPAVLDAITITESGGEPTVINSVRIVEG